MFSCEHCEISNNNYFQEHLPMTAFKVPLVNDCLSLSSWTVVSKSILTSKPKFGAYTHFKFNPYGFF